MNKKRGRRPGLLANPDAFADSLDGRSQRWIAEQADMSVSHLCEVIAGTKGATPAVAQRLADVLGKRPGTLFPELAAFRTQVKVFSVAGVLDAEAA